MSKYHGKATVNKVNKTMSTSPVFLQSLRKCSEFLASIVMYAKLASIGIFGNR